MIYPQMMLDTHEELIVDLFAGGGGASCGIEMATGRTVDIAINHDAAAVALHKANHPQTKHHTSDIFEVDPRKVTEGRPVGLLWASPDCTFHSKARGGKPIRSKTKKRRALAWVVTRWAGQVRPRVIMLENVEEFAEWGPLVGPPDQLRPCPKRRGQTFRKWVRSLERLGYQVEWRELRACDYGAPTIRKRLFLIARCDDRPIVWPKATHGPEKGLKPYRTAAECIDWSIPMLSIFATREEAKDWAKAQRAAGNQMGTPVRPLAEATMRRVARGTMRYVVENPQPYIVGVGGRQGQSPERPLDRPMQTVTAKGDSALIAPVVVPNNTNNAPQSPESPMPTVTGGGRNILAAPYLTECANASQQRIFSADEPMRTQVSGVKGGHFALAAPYLIPRYGEREGQKPRTRSIEEPSPVIVPSGNGASVCAAFLAQHNTGLVGHDARKPVSTIVQKGSTQGIVAAHVSSYHAAKNDGDTRAASIDEPIATIDTSNRYALVSAFIAKYYGTGDGAEVSDPAPTVTTKDRFGLVTVKIQGVLHAIVDIAMRMFQPRELYTAQGFPPNYVITCQVWDPKKKRLRWLNKTEQVRMCGNSVSPVHPATMVRDNLPELIARDEVLKSAAA